MRLPRSTRGSPGTGTGRDDRLTDRAVMWYGRVPQPERLMGMMADYTCPSCGYHVDGMVSGYDMGMASHVVGVACVDCRKLHVAPVPGEPWDQEARGAAQEATNAGRVPPGSKCPRSARHRIAL